MALQNPTIQPTEVAGHNGLADPEHRELWVEVDASGSDQRLEFDSKQMVASQLHITALLRASTTAGSATTTTAYWHTRKCFGPPTS